MTVGRVNASGLFKHLLALQDWGTVLICPQKGKVMAARFWNRLNADVSATKPNNGADSQQNSIVLAE
jgi:hypothetical protein